MLYILLRIGFCSRTHDGSIHWPFRAPPRHIYSSLRSWWGYCRFVGFKPYVFRNLPHVQSRIPGRLLPWRWGVGWLGFEFGDRGSAHSAEYRK